MAGAMRSRLASLPSDPVGFSMIRQGCGLARICQPEFYFYTTLMAGTVIRGQSRLSSERGQPKHRDHHVFPDFSLNLGYASSEGIRCKQLHRTPLHTSEKRVFRLSISILYPGTKQSINASSKDARHAVEVLDLHICPLYTAFTTDSDKESIDHKEHCSTLITSMLT